MYFHNTDGETEAQRATCPRLHSAICRRNEDSAEVIHAFLSVSLQEEPPAKLCNGHSRSKGVSNIGRIL